METHPLNAWFDHALALSNALADRYDRRAKNPDPVAVEAAAGWDAWQRLVENAGADWPAADRHALGAVVFGRLVKTWENRRGLDALDHEVAKAQPGAPKRFPGLLVALMDAGCWPAIGPRGTAPSMDAKEEFSFRRWLEWALPSADPVVFERLLDWPGNGTDTPVSALESLLGRSDGAGVPEEWETGRLGMTHLPPVAWMVHNRGAQVVQAWVNKGGNADDQALQRPLLAYANAPAVLAVLRNAGADPLAAHLPREQRLQAFQALWEGWKGNLRWACAPFSDEHRAWGAALSYLEQSLATWPRADVTAALARPLFEEVARTRQRSSLARSPELKARLLAWAQQAEPTLDTVWERPGQSMPYGVAMLVEWLGARPGLGEHADQPDVPTRHLTGALPNGAPARALGPLVHLATPVPALTSFADALQQSRIGWEDVLGALTFLCTQAGRQRPHPDRPSRLARIVAAVLTHPDLATVPLPPQRALVDAYQALIGDERRIEFRYSYVYKHNLPPALLTTPLIQWGQTNEARLSPAERGALGFRRLASTRAKDDPPTPEDTLAHRWAMEGLVEARRELRRADPDRFKWVLEHVPEARPTLESAQQARRLDARLESSPEAVPPPSRPRM